MFYFITAQVEMVAIGSIAIHCILDFVLPLVPAWGSGDIGLNPVGVVSQVDGWRPIMGVKGRMTPSGAAFA